jgi:hypothetical protein
MIYPETIVYSNQNGSYGVLGIGMNTQNYQISNHWLFLCVFLKIHIDYRKLYSISSKERLSFPGLRPRRQRQATRQGDKQHLKQFSRIVLTVQIVCASL